MQKKINHTYSPKIKICGLRTVADALLCEQLGVNAIGLVFYDKSPRVISAKTAQEIVQSLPPFITIVGLFVNPDANKVYEILSKVSLDCLQFHGNESDEFCSQFGRKWFKAIQVYNGINLSKMIKQYPNSTAILVDTADQKQFGGTGQSFDWAILPEKINKPLILAGGLKPENIQTAIAKVRPWAVDVSSGVELKKGVKSSDKIQQFVENCQNL